MNESTELAIQAFMAHAILHTMTGFTLTPAMLLFPVHIATGIIAEIIAVAVTVCNHWVKLALIQWNVVNTYLPSPWLFSTTRSSSSPHWRTSP